MEKDGPSTSIKKSDWHHSLEPHYHHQQLLNSSLRYQKSYANLGWAQIATELAHVLHQVCNPVICRFDGRHQTFMKWSNARLYAETIKWLNFFQAEMQ